MLRVTIALASAGVLWGCGVGSVPSASPERVDGGAEAAPDGGSTAPPPITQCQSCHGDETSSAPPQSLSGETDRADPGVGAHRVHLEADPTLYAAVACESCHQVPDVASAPGHIDGDDQAEVLFGARNPAATYDFEAAGCDNLYCHGDGRGDNGSLSWTAQTPMTCTSCHSTGGGLSGEHNKHFEEGLDCVECHQDVAGADLTIIGAELHLNGARDVSIAQGGTYDPQSGRCSNLACHEDEGWQD